MTCCVGRERIAQRVNEWIKGFLVVYVTWTELVIESLGISVKFVAEDDQRSIIIVDIPRIDCFVEIAGSLLVRKRIIENPSMVHKTRKLSQKWRFSVV